MWRIFLKARYEIITGLLAFATAGFVVLMILASRSVLLSELQWHFERSALLEGNINQIMLVSKYQNQRNLYHESIDPRQVDELELRFGKVLESDHSRSEGAFSFTNPLSRAAAVAINAFRQILGKGALPTEEEIEANLQLYQAFRLEYSLQYRKALDVYAVLAVRTEDPVLNGVIQLHQGFCYAMLGQDKVARDYFQQVRQTHPGTDLSWTAQKLLMHMDALYNEKKQLQASDLPSLLKARKYVYLMECDTAMHILDSLPSEQKGQAESLVLQGRCAEEKGEARQAARKYLEAVALAKNTPLARQANRRLFLLSERAPDTLALKAVALRLNTTLQDTMIARFEETAAETDTAAITAEPTGLSPDLAEASHAALKAVAFSEAPTEKMLTEKKAGPAVRTEKKAEAVSAEKVIVIRQKSGSQITGTVVSAPGAPVILIRTLAGTVGIPRNEIDSPHIP